MDVFVFVCISLLLIELNSGVHLREHPLSDFASRCSADMFCCLRMTLGGQLMEKPAEPRGAFFAEAGACLPSPSSSHAS